MASISGILEHTPGVSPAAEHAAPVATPSTPTLPEPAPEPAPAPRVETPAPLVVEEPNLKASYVYDRDLNRVIITLVREDSGEVVRQIPSEQLLRCLAGLMEVAGKTFDGKA